MSAPKFRLGHLVATPNSLATIPNPDILSALGRHISGDWGDVNAEDRAANDLALVEGTRLFSEYISAKGLRFWIITEADRSATKILLPEDY